MTSTLSLHDALPIYRVAGDGTAAKARNDSNETDPARHADKDLKRTRRRETDEPRHDRRLETKMFPPDSESPTATKEPDQCDHRTGATSNVGGDCSPDYAQLWKRPDAKD